MTVHQRMQPGPDASCAGRYTKVLEGSGAHPAWAMPAEPEGPSWPPLTPISSLLGDLEGSGGKQQGPGGQQANKWGFVPGEEDTMDLNLEHRGAR